MKSEGDGREFWEECIIKELHLLKWQCYSLISDNQIHSILKIAFIFITLQIIIYSGTTQDLNLISGNSERTIKSGTFIQIQLPAQNQQPCDDCPLHIMKGQFLGIQNDLLRLRVSFTSEIISEDETIIGYVTKNYTDKGNSPILTIPKDIVLSITKKGRKKLIDTHPVDGVAIALGIVGLSSLAAIAVADEEAGPILTAGVIEIGIAVIMGSAFKQKKFITSPECPDRKNHRIWVLK